MTRSQILSCSLLWTLASFGCSHDSLAHSPGAAGSGTSPPNSSAGIGAAAASGNPVAGSAASNGGVAGQSGSAGSGVIGVDAGHRDAAIDDDAGTIPGGAVSSSDAGPPTLQPTDLVVAPTGTDTASGSLSDPMSLTAALPKLGAGHTIYLRAGSYTSNKQITIAGANSGDKDHMKQLFAYADEKPILDFSSEPYGTGSNPRGLEIDGSYWHVRGLTVQGAADNGIYVAGSGNVIENCVVHGNRDTGLQLGRSGSSASMADWPSNNLILNCESYDNYDAPPGAGENADGFAAKLTVGTGNVFRGCVSHNNIDDGWDLYTKSDSGPIGPVTIDQCISHHNGTLTDGTTNANGDRNGFKLGGEKIAVAHLVTRSVAFSNGAAGFTWNSNPGAIRLSNTLGFDNAAGNYSFGNTSTMTQAVFTNNVSFWTKTSGAVADKTYGQDASMSDRFWTKSGSTVSASDFAHSLAAVTITRAADGGIDWSPFTLASGSPLIDAGVVPAGMLPFDLSYYRGKPDLGAVETQ